MSQVFHIGDLHIGHRNICKYRTQFNSTDEHDDYVVDRVLTTCGKRDTLWLHGDILFDRAKMHLMTKIIQRIGVVHLIIGNHCTEGPQRQDNVRWMMSYGVKLHSLVSYKGAWLSHHPIHPVELRGKFNIHGHVHQKTIEEPGYFNVSADAIGFTPRRNGDIMAAIREENHHAFRS